MAGIGRPTGSRRPSAERVMAMHLFNTWRNEGHPMRVTRNTAFEISCALAGEKDGDEIVSLAAVALRTAICVLRGKGLLHIPYNLNGRRVCGCGDFNCASLDKDM